MNKQELYDKINQLPTILGWPRHSGKVTVAKDSVLELVRQLDEPQKVVVPKFVAEWIEDYKGNCRTVYLGYNVAIGSMGNIRDWACANPDTFARAWLDGYSIEREKLYTVEIPNPNTIGTQVNVLLMNAFHEVVIVQKYGEDWKTERGHQLTEAEIRKDFEWAWQFAKEVDR